MEANKKAPAGKQRAIEQGKDTKRLPQKQPQHQYLFENIATASMVADATGIYQKNIQLKLF